jgi:hypothetical protein
MSPAAASVRRVPEIPTSEPRLAAPLDLWRLIISGTKEDPPPELSQIGPN